MIGLINKHDIDLIGHLFDDVLEGEYILQNEIGWKTGHLSPTSVIDSRVILKAVYASDWQEEHTTLILNSTDSWNASNPNNKIDGIKLIRESVNGLSSELYSLFINKTL